MATERKRLSWYLRLAEAIETEAGLLQSKLAIDNSESTDPADAQGKRADSLPPRNSSTGDADSMRRSAAPSSTIALEQLLELGQLATTQEAVISEKLNVQKAMLDALLEPVVDLPESLGQELATEQPSEDTGETNRKDSESTPQAEAGPTPKGPFLGVFSASQEQQSPSEDESSQGSHDTYDPYVSDIEAELADTVERLDAYHQRAALQSRIIRLCELDKANISQWLELVEPKISISASSPADDQFGRAELSEDILDFHDSIAEHRQWRLLLEEQLRHWSDLREHTLQQVTQLEGEIASLRMRSAFLRSPLAPHRLKRWLIVSGPYALAIIATSILAWIISRPLIRRTVREVAMRRRLGTAEEREERAETLRRMIQGIANYTFLIICTLGLLEQFGVDVTVMLGGAAVLGMAIAFGAQNLIKDYFGGLLILTENQYRVGNVVRLGGITGLVEDVSLRMTILRDLEGVAHFIPHGQISTVSNLTHGWSRAVLDIGVAYKEDVDRVIEVLGEVNDSLFDDPNFGHLLLDRAEILGVDALGDSAVVIRFMVRTRPLKQWEVKRELLRRIKNRFDELGIEIPFPHRTIFHRNVAESSNSAVGYPGVGY